MAVSGYIGDAAYIKFGSTVLSPYYRKLTPTESIDLQEKTSGAEANRTYRVNRKHGKVDLECVMPQGTAGTALWDAVKPGTEGTLQWYPEGTPFYVHYVNAIVQSRGWPLTYNDVTTFNVNFEYSGAVTMKAYIDKVLGYSPIAYWPLYEASGSVATCVVDSNQNGAYTGVDLGQTGIGDGLTCPYFDGSSDYVNIYTTTFRDAFDGAEGTFAVWAKVYDSSVWTDGAYDFIAGLRVDANNYIWLANYSSPNNFMLARYVAGGTSKAYWAGGHSDTGWMHWAMTWSASADELKVYKNGSQIGVTYTGLGVWAGNLSSTQTVIGAWTTAPANPGHFYIAHAAVWDTPLNATQIADLYSLMPI